MPAFVHRLRVRYAECDAQGVVFNAQYLFLHDVAFTELFREAGCPYDELLQNGVDVVVAEASLRFLGGARFDDELDIELSITKLGTTSMIVKPVFRVNGEDMVEGEVRYVFVAASTTDKREIPDDVRRALEPYVVG